MSRDHLDMTIQSMEAFADGRMSRLEFDDLVDIALRDGHIDDEERRVLAQVAKRLTARELDAGIRDRLVALEREHGVGVDQ